MKVKGKTLTINQHIELRKFLEANKEKYIKKPKTYRDLAPQVSREFGNEVSVAVLRSHCVEVGIPSSHGNCHAKVDENCKTESRLKRLEIFVELLQGYLEDQDVPGFSEESIKEEIEERLGKP